MKIYLFGVDENRERERFWRGYAEVFIEVNDAFYRICVYEKERYLLDFERLYQDSLREARVLNHDMKLVLPRYDSDSIIKWANTIVLAYTA